MRPNSEQAALLQAIATGDKAAFTALYRDLERPVYRFISAKLNDPFEANDIVHEVFMEIWRSAAKFEGRSAVKTWIFGIAYRKTMDRFRKAKNVSYSDNLPDAPDEGADQVADLEAREQGVHIKVCMDKLSPEHRLAVELAFFDDMNYREVAEVVGSPEGTVKTRIFHAKKLLQRCLATRIGKEYP
jgi:RNA polymerase sigma factor (sigma-70 family)